MLSVCTGYGAGSAPLECLALEPEFRKAMAKLQYADAWAHSLEESHAPGEDRDRLLENFWKEVGWLRGAAQRLGLEDVQDVASRLGAPQIPRAAWF